MSWGPLETYLQTGRIGGIISGVENPARFVLDEDVDFPEALAFLDGEGIGANELPNAYCRSSDEEVLAYVNSLDEMLVTHDNGFFDEKRHPPETNPGVIIVPGGSGDLRKHLPLIAHVLKLIRQHRGLWRHTYIRINPDATVLVKIPASDDHLPTRLVRIVFDSAGKPEVFSAEDLPS